MDDLPPRSSWRVAQPTAFPLPPRIVGLLEEETDAFPVRIVIVQDGVRTGWGDGVLGFEPNALWFSGRACSFRIAALEVLPGAYLPWGGEVREGGSASSKEVRLRHPVRRVLLRVERIGIGGQACYDLSQRLDSEIQRLRACDRAGESQYPPLAPRDGTIPKPPTRKQSLAFLLTLLAVSIALMVWKPSVFPVAGALFGVGEMRYRWRTNGDSCDVLQRIAAEEAVSLLPP